MSCNVEIKQQHITIENHSIYVETSGQGKPILMINGLGGDPKVLENIRRNLLDYQIITYDPPGVGKSSDIFWPLKMKDHAIIAHSVLETFGIERATIFGVSWGGAVAQEIAVNHPEVIHKLILVSTMPGPFLITSPSVLFNRYIKTLTGTKTEWLQIGSLLSWSSLFKLGNINSPTLILNGTDDSLVLPYNAYLLNLLIPNSTLKLIEDQDHWLVVNGADEISSMINNFID